MKGKFTLVLLLIVAVAAVAFIFGRTTSHDGTTPRAVRPEPFGSAPAQPAKPTEPPATEEMKIWTRHQEMLAEFKLPDPKEMEKMSDEERAAKIQELQQARQKQEEEAMVRLHREFSGVKGTDLPLILRKVQEFIAVITPRYYAYQEEEVRRLQTAGAFSDAALPLIKEEALNHLAKDFPAVGEAGIKQLLGVKE